jgi:serine protease Do
MPKLKPLQSLLRLFILLTILAMVIVLSLPESSADQALSAADVFRQRRSSVVIVGSMNADGAIRHATGCVLTSSGVIVTAYHVLAEPAVSRGVLTLDGKVYPVSEVLAASKPDDLALIRIPAHDLQPAPLSKGDRVGSEVTVISHPGTAYFNLTHGFITRYSAGIEYGHLVVRMGLTAEFARGSSGAPVFNSQGEVAGVVLATDTFGEQMVYRTAAPAGSIRKLVREPKD